MEIVHVIRQYKPSIGGLEAVVFNLCRDLAKMPGARVRIVTLNRVFTNPNVILPAHEIIDGIEVTRIGYIGSKRYPIAPGVLKAIKSADVVHVHAIDFFFDFLALTRWLHRKPLVASTHGGFFHTAFAATLKKLYFQTVTRLSCSAYSMICASSENDAATFGRISDRVVTLENGVDVEKWRDCGSKTAEKRMIFIGRWSANKRVPLLIALLAELNKFGDWQLDVLGMPSDHTYDMLAAAAKEHGVENKVHIQAGPSEDEIRRKLASVSYIASASDYEGFGVSIIEGLSAGLVPIVSPIPPFEKLLGALGFGERIDSASLAASAQAIEQAHQTLINKTDSLRKQCMTLSAKYAWGDIAARFMEMYERAFNHAK